MQAFSDFRVNCYPQTVIDLVLLVSARSHIVSYANHLWCFALYSASANGMLRVLIRQLLEGQYKIVEKCTKSVEIGTAPFTSSAFAMAIIGLKGENRTY